MISITRQKAERVRVGPRAHERLHDEIEYTDAKKRDKARRKNLICKGPQGHRERWLRVVCVGCSRIHRARANDWFINEQGQQGCGQCCPHWPFDGLTRKCSNKLRNPERNEE